MNAQKARELSVDGGLSYEDKEVLQEILNQIETDAANGYVFSNLTTRFKARSTFCQANIQRSLMVRGFTCSLNEIYWH